MTSPTSAYQKPLPRPANPELTKPFWEAAKRHEFVLPRCRRCSRYHFFPRELCPYCFSRDIEWTQSSGRAHLYSYAIINQPPNPTFAGDVPYVYAIVQLVEGVLMPSNIVQCSIPDGLRIDMPLTAVFDDVTPEWTLLKFKPA
jgi:uncharacterized OB-fold protein